MGYLRKKSFNKKLVPLTQLSAAASKMALIKRRIQLKTELVEIDPIIGFTLGINRQTTLSLIAPNQWFPQRTISIWSALCIVQCALYSAMQWIALRCNRFQCIWLLTVLTQQLGFNSEFSLKLIFHCCSNFLFLGCISSVLMICILTFVETIIFCSAPVMICADPSFAFCLNDYFLCSALSAVCMYICIYAFVEMIISSAV